MPPRNLIQVFIESRDDAVFRGSGGQDTHQVIRFQPLPGQGVERLNRVCFEHLVELWLLTTSVVFVAFEHLVPEVEVAADAEHVLLARCEF